MPTKPIIESKYIDNMREIRYFGRDDTTIGDHNEIQANPQDNTYINNGHYFQILNPKDEKVSVEAETFEVIGWVERTLDCPYDFILVDTRNGKHYIANLHGRSDGWPLFAIQNGKAACSRSAMGSEWNCRLCAKYFGTVCKQTEINQIRQDIKHTYDCLALKYHELFHDEMKQKEFDRNLLDRFAITFDKDSRLCDLGCGPSGHITRYLFDKGLTIEGIDISDKCIEIAKQENPGIEFYVKDMTCLDYPDALFDGIISFYSILHTPKNYQHLIFAEFNRVLKKGGKALVVVKMGEDEGYIDEMLGCKAKIHFANFLENEIEKYFNDNGFRLTYLETRKPYEFEISVPRIYALAEKI